MTPLLCPPPILKGTQQLVEMSGENAGGIREDALEMSGGDAGGIRG